MGVEGLRVFFMVGITGISAFAGVLSAFGVHPILIVLAGLAGGGVTATTLLLALVRL